MSFAASLLAQLLSQTPTLLAALVGCLLAAVYWSRHANACAFLFAGCLLYLLASIGGTAATAYLIANRDSGVPSVAPLVGVIGVVAGAVRAGALGLLIAAALSGRTPRP